MRAIHNHRGSDPAPVETIRKADMVTIDDKINECIIKHDERKSNTLPQYLIVSENTYNNLLALVNDRIMSNYMKETNSAFYVGRSPVVSIHVYRNLKIAIVQDIQGEFIDVA